MPSGRTNNSPESGRGLGQVTPTIFDVRSNISLKLFELETSNLVRSFVWAMPSRRTNNFPRKWAWPRSRDPYNFGSTVGSAILATAWLLVFAPPPTRTSSSSPITSCITLSSCNQLPSCWVSSDSSYSTFWSTSSWLLHITTFSVISIIIHPSHLHFYTHLFLKSFPPYTVFLSGLPSRLQGLGLGPDFPFTYIHTSLFAQKISNIPTKHKGTELDEKVV